jgi:Domain of unknown function (DUF4112)
VRCSTPRSSSPAPAYDTITTALSLFIVHEAYQLGAPGHVSNVALDGVLAAVPVVGDAFDVLWRANRRNLRLLVEWLEHERRDPRHWLPTRFAHSISAQRTRRMTMTGALMVHWRQGSFGSAVATKKMSNNEINPTVY